MLKILLPVFLLCVQLMVRTNAAGMQCSDTNTGCPISTSPATVDECNGIDKLATVTYCGGYALCFGGSVGIRYQCPAGFVPGPKCVEESSVASNETSSCPEVLCDVLPQNIQNGCPNGTIEPSPCPSSIGESYIDDPDACGQFTMCVLTYAFSYICPVGYRSNAEEFGPKCVEDYRCTDMTQPRLPVCTNYVSGCTFNDTQVRQALCASFGVVENPDQCGSYVVCTTVGMGISFECPLGYRTDITNLNQVCVADPSCSTPISPRLAVGTGDCKDALVGCAVKNITVMVDDCVGKPAYITNINDASYCGFYLKCTLGGGAYPAVQYVCPIGFKADASTLSSTGKVCVQDSTCPTPTTPRLTVVLKAAPPGGDVLVNVTESCTNAAFGCALDDTPTDQAECQRAHGKWSFQQIKHKCRGYVFCFPDGTGLAVECPLGYRARVARAPSASLLLPAPRGINPLDPMWH